MNTHKSTDILTDKVTLLLLPALFAALPLVYDADLYRFSLLPKRLLLQGALLVLALVLTRDLLGGRLQWMRGPCFLPATTFILWTSLTTPLAEYNVFGATVFLSQQVTFFLTFVVLSQVITQINLSKSIEWLCWSICVLSTIGILEFWGVDVSAIPSNGRPSSTFAYRNFAASYLIAALPLIAVHTLQASERRGLVLGSAAGMLGSLFLIYTRSRGAWVGGLVGFTFGVTLFVKYRFDCPPSTSVLRRRSAWRVPVAAALITLVMAPWSPQVSAPHSRHIDEGKTNLLDAISSVGVSGANRGRRIMWTHTASMVADHPVTGLGPDNWKLAYPAYDQGDMIQVGSAPERPHNDFLWIAAETGVVGLGLFIWLIISAILAVCRPAHRKAGNTLLVVAAISGAVALLAHGVFSFPRERIESSFLFWSCLATVDALSGQRKRTDLVFPYAVPAVIVLCLAITVLEIRFDRALLRGLESFAGGDMVSLDRHTRDGLSAGPFDSRMHLLRNKVEQSGRNYPLAQQACMAGLRYHPNSVELYSDLGMAYALNNELVRAEATLLRAADLSPNHHPTFNNLGGVYQGKGELDKAESAYLKATQIKQDYPDAWSNLGLLQMVKGQHNNAVQSFTNALRHQRNNPALHHNLADALYVRQGAGDLEQAGKHYEVFLRMWRGDPSETSIAKARMKEIRSQ